MVEWCPIIGRISPAVIRLTIIPCIYLILTRLPVAFFRAFLIFNSLDRYNPKKGFIILFLYFTNKETEAQKVT